MISKPEHAPGRRLLHPRTGQRAQAASFQIGGDAAQPLRRDRPRCRSRGRARRRSPPRARPGCRGRPFSARSTRGDHVAHHFRRRVPDPELLAERRVEGFEEGLVEVGAPPGSCPAPSPRVEAGRRRRCWSHPVERRRRPVQHFHEAERLQAAGVGELLEQRPQHRRAQGARPPCASRTSRLSVPEGGAPPSDPAPARAHSTPGGEDAVEQGLHQGRAEEARALLALEAHPERLFERLPHHRQRRRIARCLHPRETVPGIGRKQPRQVLRFRRVRPGATAPGTDTRQDPAPTLREKVRGSSSLRWKSSALSARRKVSQLRRAAPPRLHPPATKSRSIGHQNQSVAVPVAADLIARRSEPRIASRGGADSGGPSLPTTPCSGVVPLAGPAPLDLLRPIETGSRGGPRPGRPAPRHRTPWA